MSTAREHVMELVRSLPEDYTVDEIMYELYVQTHIEQGLAELERGKGIPHEEIMSNLFKRWLQE